MPAPAQNTGPRTLRPIPRPPQRCTAGAATNSELLNNQHRRRTRRTNPKWGNRLRKKRYGRIRILLQNVGGLGTTNTPKWDKLKHFLLTQTVDLVGLSEVNVYWKHVPYELSFQARTKSWWDGSRTSIAYNQQWEVQDRRTFQSGGTLTSVNGKASARTHSTGQDPRNLGRWSWVRFQGKNNLQTVILTAYCPTKSASGGGAYGQQSTALAVMDPPNLECPRKVFWLDLAEQINQWNREGCQLILMGDWNSDFNDVNQWMRHAGLHNIISDQHGYSNAPVTYQRSAAKPLDSIYTNRHIKAEKSGFLSFERLEGDHRGIWVDIDEKALFGCNTPDVIPPSARRLRTDNPILVHRYNKSLHQYFQQFDLYNQIFQLHHDSQYPLAPRLQMTYESLHAKIRQCQLLAEKLCRRMYSGRVKWSPDFTRAAETIEYWRIAIKRRKKEHFNSRRLRRLQRRYDLPPYNLALEELKQHLSASHKERRRVKENAESLSLEYREQLAQAKETAGQGSAASHIRALNHREAQRKIARKLKYIRGKLGRTSTTYVTRTLPDGSTEEITEKTALEAAIISENVKKYHQTEDSISLLSGQLKDDIGITGEGPAVPAILDGTYDIPSSASPSVRSFLRQVKRPHKVLQPSFFDYNVTKFRQSWKRKNEGTGSSGPHFGHYRAICNHRELSWIFTLLADLPFKSGYNTTSHRQTTSVMIPKKANSMAVNKLRTIGLIDSERNHVNSRIGYTGMHAALALDQIAPEQYSRPGRSAASHGLNRRLIFDHQRYCRMPWSLACSDLKSCYDRVLHAAASLALQRLGIPAPGVIGMFDSIQSMKFRIRTAFGLSSDTYGGEIPPEYTLPPQGLIQGNGAAPTIWSILSSLIFFALRDNGFSAEFHFAITKRVMRLAGLSYVDDCDMAQTGQSAAEAHDKMQKTITEWETLIRVTGGCLVPEKSSWYLVDYAWHRGKWKCINAIPEVDLQVSAADGREQPLQRLDPSEAMSMLGMFLAPDGGNSKQCEYLLGKTSEWSSHISSHRLSRHEAWTAVTTTIMPVIRYSLCAMTISRKEFTKIMSPIITLGLPKAGISSTTPTVMRYGPNETGGFDLEDPYVYQGCERISYLIEHIWKNTPTGQLIHINLEDIHLEAGCGGQILDTQSTLYSPWLHTPSWIQDTLIFIQVHNIHISNLGPDLLPHRISDEPLMIAFTRVTTHRPTLRALNRCRMYKRCYFLSDITHHNGTSLELLHTTKYGTCEARSPYRWPVKNHCSSQDWHLWKKSLRSLCDTDNYRLLRPLGRWYKTDIINWDYFYAPHTGELFHHSHVTNRWTRFPPRSNARRTTRHTTFDITSGLPGEQPDDWRNLERVSIQHIGNELSFTRGYMSHPSITRYQDHRPHNRYPLPNLYDVDAPCHDWSWLFQYFQRSESIDKLLRDFSHVGLTVTGGTDGSFVPTTDAATSAWRIESSCGTEFIQGGGCVPGPQDSHSSYRSELGGILGILTATHWLELLTPSSPSSEARYSCDSLSALNSFTATRDNVKTSHKHCDILSRICDITTSLRTLVTFEHVYGHQDATVPPHLLARSAQINIIVDKIAGDLSSAHPRFHSQWDLLPPSEMSQKGMAIITHTGLPITGQVTKLLSTRIRSQQLRTYLAHRNWYGPAQDSSQISGTPFKYARSNAPQSMRMFISKSLCRTLPVATIQRRRGLQDTDLCCQCHMEPETFEHVLRCPSTTASTAWDTGLTTLSEWLTSHETSPELVHIILHNLQYWHSVPSTNNGYLSSPQNEVGWYQFLHGFLHQHTLSSQQMHLTNIKSLRTPSAWASQLIQQLWKLCHSMWTNRNNILHNDNPSTEHHLHILHTSIQQEHTRGPDTLPAHLHIFFSRSLTDIFAGPVQSQLDWFRVIRTGREATQTSIADAFSQPGELRDWVGIHSRYEQP